MPATAAPLFMAQGKSSSPVLKGPQIKGKVEAALSAIASLAEAAAAALPWPGDVAARMLAAAVSGAQGALLNQRNWITLSQRAADVLQIVLEHRTLWKDR